MTLDNFLTKHKILDAPVLLTINAIVNAWNNKYASEAERTLITQTIETYLDYYSSLIELAKLQCGGPQNGMCHNGAICNYQCINSTKLPLL